MTAGGPAGFDSPIETYLDALLVASAGGRPRQVRILLAEAEAHLREDAEVAEAAGLGALDAQAQAVARFGPAVVIAAADRGRALTPWNVLVRQVVLTGVRLGGIGAVAIGASGLVAAVIRAIGGTRVLVGVASTSVLSASNCARWLAHDPASSGCRAAATSDWASETVVYRLAVGVLGLLALAGLGWLRRRAHQPFGGTVLPAVSDTIAVTAFGAAGVWLLGMGIDAVVVSSGDGSGQWLSAAPIALAAAVLFGVRLAGRLRQPVAALG